MNDLERKIIKGISNQMDLEIVIKDDEQTIAHIPYFRGNSKGSYYYIPSKGRMIETNLLSGYSNPETKEDGGIYKNEFVIKNAVADYDLVLVNNNPLYNQLTNHYQPPKQKGLKVKRCYSTSKTVMEVIINLKARIEGEKANYGMIYKQGGND